MTSLSALIDALFLPVMLICGSVLILGTIVLPFTLDRANNGSDDHKKSLRALKIAMLVAAITFCIGFGWCMDNFTIGP